MSEENVVRRNPKNNRRKNTDGYRTDSGCFEDVDLQMANRHSPTSTSSESVVVDNNNVVTTDHSSEECRLVTEHADASLISPSLADECADDKDFHAILKRLSDITTNPGDLYRLCFSSRLSFCGHVSGNTENEESSSRTGEIDQNDTTVVEPANGCTNCEISNESPLEEKYAKRSSHGQQCVELLSVLSSFMVKAKENPSMLNHSSLGNSLVAQLSSLLSTLEETKRNVSQSNEGQSITAGQQISPDILQPSTPTQLAAPECTTQPASNVAEHKTSLSPQDSNTATDKIDFTLKNSKDDHDQQASLSNQRNNNDPFPRINKTDLILREELGNQSKQPLTPSQSEELESALPSSGFSARHHSTHSDSEVDDATFKDLLDAHNKPPSRSPLPDAEKLETPLPTSSLKISFATNHIHSELHETCPTSKHPLNNQDEKPSLLNQGEEFQTSLPRIDNTNPALQHPSDNQNKRPSLLNHPEDNNTIPELNNIDGRSSTSSVTDAGDVVTNGRRAVKPYSWDYGDIWEKELERAKSSESFNNGGKGGHLPSRKDPATDMMPSFEEIRDELFQNAGFINDDGGRYDGSKRRSRSADARSNLQDDSVWSEYHSTQSDMHSPFVRTIYQNETRPSTGLRRSWSSHHIGGNSVMVNVDWTHGRQMRVITGSADRGFDDVRAQIIKEAVVKTSTFRGPKPWSVLKRRPSGLRRRSARNESFRSNKSDDSRARIEHDSESSDSPYVSATSSDCLTMATDDSSSVTSSHYYATSSLPSSPSVSNRNSACFSDTSTSDASDIRRVVYQSPSSETAPRERYTRGYDIPSTRGMTLDQRFGYIEKHNRVLPNEGFQNPSIKGPRSPLVRADGFRNEDSKNIRVQPSTLPRKWQGDRLVSPLLVRSDSDLNRLTKVQFVGDSYSRSRISKNVRYTRNRSQSSSPVGPHSAHTRVVSCEIVQSDNRKRDVYTKVNIAESLNDEEATKIHDGRNTKLGYPTTRRSWHGQSPTHVSFRLSPTNKNITPTNGSPRYSFSSRSGQQQRQIIQFQRGTEVEKPVHAKLVAVNNHQDRIRTHWSTGSLRLHASERPRLLSDTVVMNRPHGNPRMNCNIHPNFERNFNGSRSRNVGSAPASDVGMRPERRRSPPDYFTAVKHSQGLRRQGNCAYFPGAEKHLANTDKGFSTGRHSPTERNRFYTKPKEPMSHIVKETSFVGPSTFTKYQSSSNPSFTRARRSRSLNEKDTIARRRLHDSDIYRRRAMEINQKNHDGEYLNHFSRCDSDVTAVHRPEQRRRYSEGATRRPTRHDVPSSDGIVDVSYCDPRRESIREGTYSIVHAESARDGAKLDDTRIPSQIKREDHAPITKHVNGKRTTLQNGCRMDDESSFNDFGQRGAGQSSYKSIQVKNSGQIVSDEQRKIAESKCTKTEIVKGGKTISSHGKKDEKSSAVNDIAGVAGQEMRYSGSRGKQVDNSETEDRFASNEPGCDSVVVSTSSPPQENIFGGCKEEQKRFSESKSKPMEHIKSDRNSRIKIADENSLPVSPHEEINEEYMEVSLCNESSYRNTGESKGVISTTLPNEKINKTHTVVTSASRHTDDASAVILAQPLPFNNVDKNRRTSSSTLPYEENHKTKAVVSNQAVLQHRQIDEAGEVIPATELQQTRNENNAVIFQHSPCAKEDKTNTNVSHQEVYPYKQIDEVDGLISPLSQYKKMHGKKSVTSTNGLLSSAQRNSNTVDLGETAPNIEEKETNVILSPILPNRKAHDKSNEVNVFIDYRNKRPVSVEYSDEDVLFLKTLGATARMSRKGKQNTNGRINNTSCTVFDSDTSERTEQNVKNEGDVNHSRLSRKDRHEQQVLTNKVKNQNIPVSDYQPSPEPYRRDTTIIYTDARTSFGSDADSISRDSTVSSSGSDMTVILHEDMDISVDDLKQLTESGSKIGIEIAPIDVETGDELLDVPDNVPDELPPAMELSNSFTNYQKRVPGNIKANPELAVMKEASNLKENASSPENVSKNNTLKRLIDAQNNENFSGDNLVPSSCNMQSSCSSIASSRASSKSTGTENSKGKNSSKNGGKGFLSKLKSFRNSFRVKKTDSISFEKNGNRSKNSEGKITECEDLYNGSDGVARRLPSSTDANANVLSKPRNRTKSDTRSVHTQGTQDMSRRSYDAFRHPNNSLRNVVGVKSVSSDHLNAYRINNTPHMNEITAKSLEVLVETCI